MRPHERTLDGPKAGRLALMRAVGREPLADLRDLRRPARTVITGGSTQAIVGAPPLLDVRDARRHRSPALADRRRRGARQPSPRLLAEQPLVIADGHHRYETAMAYRAERRAADGDPSDPQPYDFAPSTSRTATIPASSRSRPIGSSPGSIPALARGLASAPRPTGTCVRSTAASRRSSGPSRPRRGGFPRSASGAARTAGGSLLTLRDPAVTRPRRFPVRRMRPGRSTSRSSARSSWIERSASTPSAVAVTDRIRYRRRAPDAADLVAAEPEGTAVALLLRAPSVAEVEAVAAAGETMPQKSTYFFPKLLDGLVFHPLDEEAVFKGRIRCPREQPRPRTRSARPCAGSSTPSCAATSSSSGCSARSRSTAARSWSRSC